VSFFTPSVDDRWKISTAARQGLSASGKRMTTRTVVVLVTLAVLGASGHRVMTVDAAVPGQEPGGVPSAAIVSSSAPSPSHLVQKYCVSCHNSKRRTAGLSLEVIDFAQITAENAPILEKVVRKLRSGAMPPAGMPRPDTATYHRLASMIEVALDTAAASRPNPGRPAIHRLNRAEYHNAIRDLLALEIDTQSLLPADDAAHGFDNIADHLSVSPSLLERYLSAARKISRLAVGDPAIPPVAETYTLPPHLEQYDRMGEDLPFGTRGGLAVRHHFPADGEYVFKIRLRKDEIAQIIGLVEPNQIDLRLDGVRLSLFTIEPDQTGGQRSYDPDRVLRHEQIEAGLVFRVPVKAGTRQVAVAIPQKTVALEGLRPRRLLFFGGGVFLTFGPGEMGVQSLTIEGPFDVTGVGDTPSRQRIFVCRPRNQSDEVPCARQILSTLARRAYRRPVAEQEVRTLLTFYNAGRREGDFEAGIRRALERLLVSVDFLFRTEPDPDNVAPGAVYRLPDLELASRLSFFLWSSIPDDRLLDVAAARKLTNPEVLEAEARRMLRDERSSALVNNFAAQWLFLRNVQAAKPDRYAFPDFDDNLREAFQQETELFVASQLREDRSVVELLTANYTFLNERLALHYGIPNVYGSHFRRVSLPDGQRAGLLGHGSILTATSYANRTSPVLRGKWLLENILGAPPPPPPPNVAALPEDDESGGRGLSVRERMEQHRKNAVCASCHAQMDPFGLALENFDAVGRWRTSDAGSPIDASAIMPDGTKFHGATGLRQVLADRRDEFVRTFTEKLLTYALGRGLEYFDGPAVRNIVREASRHDYKWSSIVLGIVKSTPFQMSVRSVEP
jgi:cytochrome c551/c552